MKKSLTPKKKAESNRFTSCLKRSEGVIMQKLDGEEIKRDIHVFEKRR